jgi:hypothetical protein
MMRCVPPRAARARRGLVLACLATLAWPAAASARARRAVSTTAGFALAWNWTTAAGATSVWGTVVPAP